jgi:hypothetical protein
MSEMSSSRQVLEENVPKENIESKKLQQNTAFDWLPEEEKKVVVDYRGRFVKNYNSQTDQSILDYPRNSTQKP